MLNKTTFRASENPLIASVVTPAYNEAENLFVLYKRLAFVFETMGLAWEWIIIDDHSSDATFSVISDLAKRDVRIRGIRFSRNFGSHAAITCGLREIKGNCGVVMASDLQDPPETLPSLFARWCTGAQVVWAVRAQREGEKSTTTGFSKIYYFLMRHVVGVKELPSNGADFFLIDRSVANALRQFNESHVSVFALIAWLGFRQEAVSYTKQARAYGKSGWSLEKKLILVVDSVTSFTYLPIRFMLYLGVTIAFLGFCYALFVIANASLGFTPQGWASLMVVTLIMGGAQMMMMGILGEYLWRALDEARARPRYVIEATTY